jgi:hypothetical protein
MVTYSASDLDSIEETYGQYFGFQVVTKGPVSDALAAIWGAPAAAGAKQLILQPSSGEESFYRYVEGEPVPGFSPLRTFGWNATEIVVEDLEGIHERLKDSPFQIIGTPAVLAFDFTDAISAMQVIGLADDVLYLTHIAKPVTGFDLPTAKSYVDKTFVSILGGRSIDDMSRFFQETFGLSTTPPMDGTIRVLNWAFNRPEGTKTTIATTALPDQCMIELDKFPEGTVDRPCHEGCLPPGQAMVTFRHNNLDDLAADFLEPPQAHEDMPYNGARAATLRGPTRELIELIEVQ